MNTKNDVEVVINGKQYTLCGYESSDYLQHIATHINDKSAEFKQQEGYNRLDVDMRNVMLAINLTDDYFKAQKLADELREQKEELEKEFFDVKHELLARQDEIRELEEKLEESRAALEDAKGKREETERKMIRMEAELEQSRAGSILTGNTIPAETANTTSEEQPEDGAAEPEEKKQNHYKQENKRTQRRKK